MSKNARQRGQELARWLQSLSEEEREEGNRKSREQAEVDHKEFQEAFRITAVRLTARRVLERADLAGACGRKWAVSI